MSVDLVALVAEAEEKKAAHDVLGVYTLLNDAVETKGLNDKPELLWRLSRACYDMANETNDANHKKEFAERAVAYSKKACTLDDANWAAHKWYGISLGLLGKFIPTKEKIGNAYVIKEQFELGIKLNPNDATLHHALGTWCWNVLQISMIERGFAKVLFATIPSSTYEECEASLLKSAELDPAQSYNNLLLGDLYYQLRRWQDAKTWYLKATAVPAVTDHQKRLKAEAEQKAAKCD